MLELSNTHRVVLGTDDGLVRIWNNRSDAREVQLVGHAGAVNLLAASPAESCIATASDDGTVRMWHALTGSELAKSPRHPNQILALRFTDAGRRLLAVSADAVLHVYETPYCDRLDSIVDSVDSLRSRLRTTVAEVHQ
jgi:WD40 repeat protein